MKAINYCHKKKVCHRDIKAENVIIDGDDLQVKLIDFGLACHVDPNSLMDQVIGTMLYMAPEIVQKKKYDEMSDIWALGIVLFVMLTGRVPYRQKNVKKLVKLIKIGDYDVGALHDPTLQLSQEAINLVGSLLKVDPK